MTDRDKLTALLDELFKEGLTMTPGYMADYLTKHGVAVQKHGQWEKHGYKWKCSACGDVVNIDGTPEENSLHCCPNCGARMDGDNNADNR